MGSGFTDKILTAMEKFPQFQFYPPFSQPWHYHSFFQFFNILPTSTYTILMHVILLVMLTSLRHYWKDSIFIYEKFCLINIHLAHVISDRLVFFMTGYTYRTME